MKLTNDREPALEGKKVIVLKEAVGTMPPSFGEESCDISRKGYLFRYAYSAAWVTPRNVVVPVRLREDQ